MKTPLSHTKTTPRPTRSLEGVIVSDKMNKTRVVAVTRTVAHSKYLKRFKVTKKFKAHDEKNEYATGERVVIEEARPLSREKRWRIVRRIGAPSTE